ncbi:MAG: SMP-30/gluconolactonase/LRE family protein [Myxococcales bacterium]|nr:SMP-30/gluconolactonase/LRE family protein [Myxococcales bacterium]
MRRSLKALLIVLALTSLYLGLWPVPVDPVAWEAPKAPGLVGAFAVNDRLRSADQLPLDGHEGPEDAALGPDGRLYLSTRSGHILRTDAHGEGASVFADTGGQPLGLDFAPDGRLIVADAYRGLLAIDAAGTVSVLATEADGLPIRYADAVAVAPGGRIYFTDASTKFGAEAWGGSYPASLLDLLEHGGHGRLLEHDPVSGATHTVASGLQFANGVALTDDGAALVVETGNYRVVRVELTGPARGHLTPILENLPGFPDNLRRGLGGRFWLGLVSPRNGIVDALAGWPRLRSVVQRLPAFVRPKAESHGHLVQLTARGEVQASLQDPEGYGFVTGALETPEHLFITSLRMATLARMSSKSLGFEGP